MSTTTPSIRERIASVSERLTPTERRIAREVLEDPTLLAFGTVSDLATRVGTSRPSIVRFATKLGFGGYSDLQGWAREGVSRKLSSPSARIRRPRDAAAGVGGGVGLEIESAIHKALETLDQARLHQLASPLVRAPSIWILSGETSRAGAHVLHSGLAMVRPGVHLVEEHDLGRDLSNAGEGDAAVVFDFARYRKSSTVAARALAELGVRLVAITDGPLSPLASLTDLWCELTVPAVGPFDSSLPAVTAAELLVLEVVAQLGDEARDRIDRLEQLWSATDTFLGDSTP
ncbi:MAG: MurR/RpiR family transcriptional regulator [Phycisphaerales bacterium JB040]